MTDQPLLADQTHHRLALEITRLLNGLSAAEAVNLLDNARSLILLTAKTDVSSPAFQEQVDAYNRVFGDDFRVGAAGSG